MYKINAHLNIWTDNTVKGKFITYTNLEEIVQQTKNRMSIDFKYIDLIQTLPVKTNY